MDKLIISFVDKVIEQKKLQFSASEVNFDKQLFENNILKLEANKISIIDFKLISPYFISNYKIKLNFKISEDFKSNANFINLVKNDFNSIALVHNYYLLEKEIWKLVVKESNYQYRCSFRDYLKEKNNDGVISFIKAYSDLLPELNLTVDEILENLILQTEITKSDAIYNKALYNILKGVKSKCKSDYENGVKLLFKCLTLGYDKENIISAIVSGLYENKGNEFYESVLKPLIQNEARINSILIGLSDVSIITIDDYDLFLKLINEYSRNEPFLISTLSIVFSILRSNNSQHHVICFQELKLAIENERASYYILNNLSFIENFNQEKTEIIVKLVNQDYFTIEKYIDLIGQIFWNLKSFDSFKKVVLCIIEKKPFEKFISAFLSYLPVEETIELDKFIIELLIDNSASNRHTGVEIFDELSLYQMSPFKFNILNLSPLSQYKLWVALTLDFHDPKTRLTALLPLIDSKSEFIKESFLCKLEEISEDYGGHVVSVLESNLNESIPRYSIVIERLKKYTNEFYDANIDLKRSLFELNPYYSQSKLIKKYNKIFYKRMGQTIEKGAKENSIFSLFGMNTVQLSKGGGWRTGPNSEIRQLGKVETSFAMPRSYFINPNEFELIKSIEIRQDWSDEEFLDIKMFLEYEQQ